MQRASHALAAYVVITLAATWPLAAGLGRDVAWDLGDSILNMWILAWDCEQLLAILGGDLSRLGSFFDANIFHPEPLTLAYSEHLVAQAIQIFPIYAVSRNPILCYNLLFLSTFVLSGLGMYLLVRELTGNARAAFVAGLIFAFMPYRLSQASHLQVLSAQWMPFVVYGMRRYFDTRRLRPLAGATLALVTLNLSCGYYLLFFAPVVAAYVLWEIGRRRLWRDRHVWIQMVAAAGVTAIITAPFLLPYAEVRRQYETFRELNELSRFSADVYSYATAFSEQPIWGRLLRSFPKIEGDLFPGAVPLLLAVLGIAAGIVGRGFTQRPSTGSGRPEPVEGRQAGREGPPYESTERPMRESRVPRWAIVIIAAIAVAHAVAAVFTLTQRRVLLDLGLFELQMSNVNQLLLRAAVAAIVLLIVSPGIRARVGDFMRDRGFFVAGLVVALWLSLGPAPQTLGRPVELWAPYRLLFDYVPGWDGLRVPARFAMIAMFMLAVLAGYGAAVFGRGRRALVASIIVSAAFLLEATHVPFVVNGMTPRRDFNVPEARLYRPARAPAIYHEVARQLPDGVLAELPLGVPDFDLRSMYYSLVHGRPLLNGYSGFFPRHYAQLTSALSNIPRHPELTLEALRRGGATHVIVHESAYLGDEGVATAAALRQLGAIELFRDGADVLLALPAAP